MSVRPTFSTGTQWAVCRQYWKKMFADSGMVGKHHLSFLEIGCFEGQATLWLLENVLTHPSSTITVVDTFEGSPEHSEELIGEDIYARFQRNVQKHFDLGKVSVMSGRSQNMLVAFAAHGLRFDFVYVDGSHLAPDVLEDAVRAWPMLRIGGIMVFDDYEWDGWDPERLKQMKDYEFPKPGIDAFLSCHTHDSIELHRGYQVAVQKL